MTTLRDYLAQKRDALLKRRKAIAEGALGPAALRARVSIEGGSGVRRIRIRDFQILTDSPPDFAGYDLGPSSPELQLGVLGSCLGHSWLIQAAALQIPLDSLDVEVEGFIDPRAGSAGHEDTPVHPLGLAYVVTIESPASDAEIDELKRTVEKFCPILNLLRRPQAVEGRVVRRASPALAAE